MSKPMTRRQIDLARHALGLPNRTRRSVRNSFVGGLGHPDYDDWYAMACVGYATRRSGSKLPFGGDDLFKLTRMGAAAALVRKETLCPKEFPAPLVPSDV